MVHQKTGQRTELHIRHLTGQMIESFILCSRQHWATCFPSNMKVMCGFVLDTGHHFFRVTINLIYITYDKAHGPYYRFQDIRWVFRRRIKPISFRQIQYTPSTLISKKRWLRLSIQRTIFTRWWHASSLRVRGVFFWGVLSAMEEEKGRWHYGNEL